MACSTSAETAAALAEAMIKREASPICVCVTADMQPAPDFYMQVFKADPRVLVFVKDFNFAKTEPAEEGETLFLYFSVEYSTVEPEDVAVIQDAKEVDTLVLERVLKNRRRLYLFFRRGMRADAQAHMNFMANQTALLDKYLGEDRGIKYQIVSPGGLPVSYLRVKIVKGRVVYRAAAPVRTGERKKKEEAAREEKESAKEEASGDKRTAEETEQERKGSAGREEQKEEKAKRREERKEEKARKRNERKKEKFKKNRSKNEKEGTRAKRLRRTERGSEERKFRRNEKLRKGTEAFNRGLRAFQRVYLPVFLGGILVTLLIWKPTVKPDFLKPTGQMEIQEKIIEAGAAISEQLQSAEEKLLLRWEEIEETFHFTFHMEIKDVKAEEK